MLKTYDDDLKKIKNSTKEVATKVLKANQALNAATKECERKKFDEAKSYLKNISSSLADIDNEIIKILALHTPEAKDLREVIAYLKITNEVLRASSNTRTLIRVFVQYCSSIDKQLIQEYVLPLQSSTIKALEYMLGMIGLDDVDELKDIFHEILVEEDKTDELYSLLEKKILTDLKDSSDFEETHMTLKAFRRCEKIADRAISIANLVLYIYEGGPLQKV
jgi:phosphate transport system protein